MYYMSKGRVWNRGKHDGTGLSRKKPIETTESANAETTEPSNEISNETPNSKFDVVKPMNRENWVTRPKRVINKDSKDKQ